MSKLRVENFSISLDGFGAGVHQNLDNPLGVRGEKLHEWLVGTRAFEQVHGKGGGRSGIDNDFAARGMKNVGAWILGRNMFGPIRGEWPDATWKGWWGDKPPYHTEVFVLTHFPRESVTMNGGTTFHFVTDGIRSALARATEAANGLDVRLGGGVATIKQYLSEQLIDELHIAVSPVLLGSGERLFSDVDMISLGYECVEHVASEMALHVVFKKKRTSAGR